MIDRGDYWQCAYLIRKGSDAHAAGGGDRGAARAGFAALLPWMADRVDAAAVMGRRQAARRAAGPAAPVGRDGLLLIGDAAHAMSPVGGVGINLAVQDAVATARVLGPALASGGIVPRSVLRKVQRRRWLPTVLVQGLQRIAHRVVLGRALAVAPTGQAPTASKIGMGGGAETSTVTAPGPLALLSRFPWLQGIPARMIAIGPLPEHAPAWARRPASAATPAQVPAGSQVPTG